MPPGGDPAFLILLVLFDQAKRTDKKKLLALKKIPLFVLNDSTRTRNS